MAKLTWGAIGGRFYETGVDRGVLYLPNQPGVAWNGLISVDEDVVGGEPRPYYQDGVMYLLVSPPEVFRGTINAYYRPVEFNECDGISRSVNGLLITAQKRKAFGLSYRTILGNDVQGNDYGYRIHLIYNALVSPSRRENRSIDNSVNPVPYSWQIVARPISVPGYRPTAHLIIDSNTTNPDLLSSIEDILYGTDSEAPRLPTPQEIFELGFGIVVTVHGDGSFTVTGPDNLVYMLDETSFEIVSPSAIFIDEDTYQISSI